MTTIPGLALRRILHAIPVLWAAATLVWIFMFLIPGDPARMLGGQTADPEIIAAVRAEWGLDQPAPVQYGRFLFNLARLDMGTSYRNGGVPVSSLIGRAMTRTFFLALTAAAVSAALGLLAGAIAAAWKGRLAGGACLAATTVGVSVPSFWSGLLLMLLFASGLRWFPPSGYGAGPLLMGIQFPHPSNLVLPAATLAIYYGSYLARVARAAFLDEKSQEYMRAAVARGGSDLRALIRHAMPNVLLPVVTMTGLIFGHLLGAAVATETIFNWPGLGLLMYNAIANRDLPVIEGGVIALTAAFLLVNLVVDLSYGALDPRLRT